jgi:hypothetical protein
MSNELTVQYVSEEDRLSGDFKPPSQFFIVNALGEGVYFHTRSRAKAQQVCDEIFNKGKYLVRAEVKCSLR